MENMADPQPPPPCIQQNQEQCSKTKGCTNVGYVCAAHGCNRLICRTCYELVLSKHNILDDDSLPEELAACTLKCHRKALRKAAQTITNNERNSSDRTEPQRCSWDKDTCNGEYEGSSEAMLLDWFKVPGNFAQWRGNTQGISKKDIQQQLADSINLAGLQRVL